MADTYKHGIYINELPTRLTPIISVAQPTVVIGTAPLHLANNPAPVNTPILCQSLAEYVDQFGYDGDFSKYTCDEAAYVHFQLFNVSPLIVINVLDPAKHAKQVTKTLTGLSNPQTVDAAAILSTLTAKSNNKALTADSDYTAAYDSAGKLVFTVLNQGKIENDSVELSYKEVDATAVTASDIVGGVDTTTGLNTGLECVEDVYPKLGLIPGTLIAPKFSTSTSVAAVLAAKCKDINGCFKAICAVDIDTNSTKKISDINSAKNSANLTDAYQIVCYPKVSLDGVQMHLSTQTAALLGRIDSDHDDLPFASPSNKNLQMDKSLLADGADLFLSKANANYLNGLGITTALNFAGGWKNWSVYTGAFPASTDPLNFISIRRMINWIGNSIVTNFWSKIDEPVTRRLVEGIVDSINIWLNGLTARGALLGGRIEFLEADNPTTSLAAGAIKFHVFLMPPTPAVNISFDLELDTDYLQTLFS